MHTVDVFHEFLKFTYTMTPSKNAVIEIVMVEIWGWVMGINESFFKVFHEDIGKTWGHSGTHGCATNLQIVLTIDLKVVKASHSLVVLMLVS